MWRLEVVAEVRGCGRGHGEAGAGVALFRRCSLVLPHMTPLASLPSLRSPDSARIHACLRADSWAFARESLALRVPSPLEGCEGLGQASQQTSTQARKRAHRWMPSGA